MFSVIDTYSIIQYYIKVLTFNILKFNYSIICDNSIIL